MNKKNYKESIIIDNKLQATGRFSDDFISWVKSNWDQLGDVDLQKLIQDHINLTSNPHEVTKDQVGLDQVDNTSDLNKPISNAVNAELATLDGRVDNLESNQITGVETYSTLVELQAIGSPQQNVSYKVTNDSTSTNNGYYTYNGATFNKESSNQLGTIASGNTDAVEGGKIYDAEMADFTAWLKSYNSSYTAYGLAYDGDAEPTDVLNRCYRAIEDGTIFGISGVLKGDLLVGTGSTGYIVETINKDLVSADKKIENRRFINLPSDNDFVKELYVTGWATQELFLRYFNGNDNGKVTFRMYLTDGTSVVYSYQLEQGLSIYPLNTNGDASGSGFGGYIVIDWAKYTALLNSTDQNVYKISESAKQLSNSPFIQDYLNKIETDSSIATNRISASFEGKLRNKTNLFPAWDTPLKVSLEKFILRLTVYDTKYTKTLTDVKLSGRGGSPGAYYINFKDQSGSWIAYNDVLTNGNGQTGIQRYVYQRTKFIIDITVNWDNLTTETSYGNLSIINWDTSVYSERIEIDNKSNGLIYKNVLKKNFATEDISAILTTNNGFTITQETNGLRLVASGKTGIYSANTASGLLNLINNHYYAVILDVTVNNESSNSSDLFQIKFAKYGNGIVTSNWLFRKGTGGQLGSRLIQSTIVGPTHMTAELSSAQMFFTKYNNDNTTSEILDITIHNLMVVDLGVAGSSGEKTDPRVLGKTEYDFISLVQKTGYFEQLVIAKNEQTGLRRNILYEGIKLKSLGDSLPETTSFQPWISHALGMTYDADEEKDGDGTHKPSVQGGTRVAPTIHASTGEIGTAGWSIYMRSRELKYYYDVAIGGVLLVLAGYNDPKAGDPWITGGTYTQPADYGLNDVAYTGEEIDLVTDPTLPVPSFGAAYRGMLQQIFADMPWLRVILVGPPRGMGGADPNSTEYATVAGKTAVIKQIAKEFGCPFVSLADVYGVNPYNYQYLTKDNLHFGYFGGRRVAMEILAACF